MRRRDRRDRPPRLSEELRRSTEAPWRDDDRLNSAGGAGGGERWPHGEDPPGNGDDEQDGDT
jgi:hypothetical protein